MTNGVSVSLGVGRPESEPTLGFWLKCRKCAHCWVGAYYPAAITTFLKAMRGTHCPKCATSKPLIAKQDNGVLKEPPPPAKVSP